MVIRSLVRASKYIDALSVLSRPKQYNSGEGKLNPQ